MIGYIERLFKYIKQVICPLYLAEIFKKIKTCMKQVFIHTLWVTQSDDLNKFLFELMM